jgi:molecular chaperone DnaK
MQRLRHDCDLAKIALSTQTTTSLTVRHGGKALTVPLTRELLEDMTRDLLQRTFDTTELVLEQAGITAKDLDALVLVGGSTLMPCVRRGLEELTGIKPFTGISPHTAVAQGAAIHAAILEAKHRREGSELAERVRKYLQSIQQENVNSHGLGVVARNPRTGKYVNHVMIPRNSRIPIEVTHTFRTNHDNQRRVNVKVMEGDAPDPRACTLIGNCYVHDLPPGLPKGSPVEVTYAFDSAGRVHVRARASDREASIQIERRGGLSEAQVDAFAKLASEYTVE